VAEVAEADPLAVQRAADGVREAQIDRERERPADQRKDEDDRR